MSETRTPESPAIHRLRNHLAVVVSFSELLLLDMKEDDPKHADIVEIKKAAMAAMALMPDIAGMARGQR